MEEFHKRLKECRLNNGFSQIELAKMLDIQTYPDRGGRSETTNVYGRYERGTYEPRVTMIKKMCSVLHVSADYLLGITDNPKPNLPDQKFIQDFSTDELMAELKRRWDSYGK